MLQSFNCLEENVDCLKKFDKDKSSSLYSEKERFFLIRVSFNGRQQKIIK